MKDKSFRDNIKQAIWDYLRMNSVITIGCCELTDLVFNTLEISKNASNATQKDYRLVIEKE
jgi:hypothetical protein